MKQHELFPDHPELKTQEFQEELLSSFNLWLLERTTLKRAEFINKLIDQLSDEQLLPIAEDWLKHVCKHELHY